MTKKVADSLPMLWCNNVDLFCVGQDPVEYQIRLSQAQGMIFVAAAG